MLTDQNLKIKLGITAEDYKLQKMKTGIKNSIGLNEN